MKSWSVALIVCFLIIIWMFLFRNDPRITTFNMDGCEYVVVENYPFLSLTAAPSQPDTCYDKYMEVKNETIDRD